MSTSMNNTPPESESVAQYNGALADGFTFTRLILTPIIMIFIIKAWSGQPDDPFGFVSLNMELVILSLILFALAALTDIADDIIGGSAYTNERKYGWFDDIADAVLINGVLLALLYVTNKAGFLHWTFAVPALAYMARDLIVGIFKGYELSKYAFLETRLGDVKNVFAALAICVLIASPWLSSLTDRVQAGSGENVMKVYNTSSTLPWNTGLILLSIATILALITGYQVLSTKTTTLPTQVEAQE